MSDKGVMGLSAQQRGDECWCLVGIAEHGADDWLAGWVRQFGGRAGIGQERRGRNRVLQRSDRRRDHNSLGVIERTMSDLAERTFELTCNGVIGRLRGNERECLGVEFGDDGVSEERRWWRP